MMRIFLAMALVLIGGTSGRAQQTLQNRVGYYFGYLRNAAVQKELALSAEQIAKIQELAAEYRSQSFRGENPTRLSAEERAKQGAEMTKKRIALDDEYLPKLLPVFTAEQIQRLKQLDWQNYGGGAVWQQEVAKAIQVTPEQQAKLEALYGELNEVLQAQGIEAVRKLRDQRVAEFLTAEQNEKLAQLKGKAFDVAQLQTVMQFPAPEGAVRFGLPNGVLSPNLARTRVFSVKAVQDELALTESQREKVNAITKELAEKYQAMVPAFFETLRGVEPAERIAKLAELRTKTAALEDEHLPQLTALLTPEQVERLRQIRWQAAGPALLLDNELVAELKLSSEQQVKHAAIVKEAADKLAAVSPEQLRARTPEIMGARDRGLQELLTASQQEQLEKLKGKPFDVAALRSSFGSGGPGGPPSGTPVPFGPSPRTTLTGNSAFSQPAVLRELELAADQQTKIAELSRQLREKTAAVAPNSQTIRELAPEERSNRLREIFDKRRAIDEEYAPQFAAVLTPVQAERLQQIRWQVAGAAAIMDRELSKQLKLSDEQYKKLATVRTEANDKLAALRVRGGFLSREQVQEMTTKQAEIQAAQQQAMMEILTEEQKEQLEKLKGKPFDLTQLSRRGFTSSRPEERTGQ